MKRLTPTLSCVAALGLSALGLSGCSSALGYAAKVNGTVITRTQLDQQLADFARNKDAVAQLDQPGSGGPVRGAGQGSYNKAFVDQLLNQRIQVEIIHERLAAAKALPSPTDLATARTVVVAQLTQSVFNAFPPRYQDILVRQQAEQVAFVKTSDASIDEFYQAHQIDYQAEVCVRHILLAEPGPGNQVDFPASLTKAKQAGAELAAGADFATVAKAQSKDNQGASGGSAAQGGTLTGSAPDGCITNQDLQRVVAPFAQAVISLPVNQVSDPVRTQFGYHLIEVTKRVIQPLDATVKANIVRRLALARLNELLKVATVKVNPEFGSFNRTVDSSGQILGVQPPTVGAPTTTTSLPSG